MKPTRALELFDDAIAFGGPALVLTRLDSARLRVPSGGVALPPLFDNLLGRRRRTVEERSAALTTDLVERLRRLTAEHQNDLLLELVNSQVALVLGHTSHDTVDPRQHFQDLGFDSLTAVELLKGLKGGTGLPLSPTLIFDHPTPSALARHLKDQLVEEYPPEPNDEEIWSAITTIPLKDLRAKGLLDKLLVLAKEQEQLFKRPDEVMGDIDTMSPDDLVAKVLGRESKGDKE